MKVEKLSASMLQIAERCPARFKATRDAGRDFEPSSKAALIGTTVHDALEKFVTTVFVENAADFEIQFLLDTLDESYDTIMRGSDSTEGDKNLCIEMCKNWFDRCDLREPNVTVISAEKKENFPLYTRDHSTTIPFTFIFDRLDKIGPNEYRIVDYKTSAWNVRPDDLMEEKIQARVYALAVQIKYPDAEQIWVEFDMLRHDGPVGRLFKRSDNISTWRYLQSELERILLLPEEDPEEILNDQCLFCIRKTQCSAILRNIGAGGIMGMTPEEVANLRLLLWYQMKAVRSTLDECDNYLMNHLRQEDVFKLDTDFAVISVNISRRRALEIEKVKKIVGPEIFEAYGGTSSMSMSDFDMMIKDPRLTKECVAALEKSVLYKEGEPRINSKGTSRYS